jgi:hypothetical protein
LTCVPTWAGWDEADLGFRMRLDAELVTFKTSHEENINEAYKKGYRACNVVTLSLTESPAHL